MANEVRLLKEAAGEAEAQDYTNITDILLTFFSSRPR